MAKGIFARLFGKKENNVNNKKSQPVKKSRVVSNPSPNMSQSKNVLETPPKKTTVHPNMNTTTTTSTTTTSTTLPNNNQKMTPSTPSSNHVTVQQPLNTDKEDHFFSDSKDKLTDISDFINAQGNNDINLHLKNLENLHDRVSYTDSTENDEFMTLSSTTSSSLSLQDALFSHFSNDTRSEISSFSSVYTNTPKIMVQTQRQSPSTTSQYDDSIFDRRFSVADTNSTTTTSNQQYYPTIDDFTHSSSGKDQIVYFEKQFCNMYIEALELLSPKSTQYSPARAFTHFEFIAVKGHSLYPSLNTRTQTLVSFAQYRAGRMLCEAEGSDDDMTEQGLLHLVESSRNGNGRADFILGCYAEQRGDLDRACQLYHKAAMANVLPAKVSFGKNVLFHGGTGQLDDAIYMLEEASSEVTLINHKKSEQV